MPLVKVGAVYFLQLSIRESAVNDPMLFNHYLLSTMFNYWAVMSYPTLYYARLL